MSEHGRFTVAVSALVEHRRTRDVLLLKRSQQRDFAPGIWEDVSGRLYQGEHPEQALRREIREETGITDVRITGMLRAWHTFRGPKRPEWELIGIAFACQTSSTEITLSEEHDEYRWLPAEEAVHFAGTDGIGQTIRAFIARRAPVGRHVRVTREPEDDSATSAPGASWEEFERRSRKIGVAARDVLDRVELAMLATLGRDGRPRMSFIEPRFFEGELVVATADDDTKTRDLRRDGRCSIHAMESDWAQDEIEFKAQTLAEELDGPRRARVLTAASRPEIGWAPTAAFALRVVAASAHIADVTVVWRADA